MESKQMFISHTEYHKYYSFNILYIFIYHVNALTYKKIRSNN